MLEETNNNHKTGVSEQIAESVFNEIDTNDKGFITAFDFNSWKSKCNVVDIASIVAKAVFVYRRFTNKTIYPRIYKIKEKRLKVESYHERQSTDVKRMQYALADERYERIQMEEEKKKLEYQLADATLEKLQKLMKPNNCNMTKMLQYQLAEERLTKFDQDLQTRRVQYELADEKLQRMQLAAERDKVRVHIYLKNELEQLQHELKAENMESVRKSNDDASSNQQEVGTLKDELKLAQYQLADEKMQLIHLQRKHSQVFKKIISKIINCYYLFLSKKKKKLEDDSKKIRYDLAEEKMEKIELVRQLSSKENSLILSLREQLEKEKNANLQLENEKLALKNEVEHLSYQLEESKQKLLEIERYNSFITDEKKKLEFQLAGERMEKLVLVKQLSKPLKLTVVHFLLLSNVIQNNLFFALNHKEADEVEKLNNELEGERNKRKEMEETTHRLQRRASQMGIDLIQENASSSQFELDPFRLQQQLADEKNHRMQIEIEKDKVIRLFHIIFFSFLSLKTRKVNGANEQTKKAQEWENKYPALQASSNFKEDSSVSATEFVEKQEFERLQSLFTEERMEKIKIVYTLFLFSSLLKNKNKNRNIQNGLESQKMQEELHLLREIEETEGVPSYAQLSERVQTLETENAKLRKEYNDVIEKKKALQEQVDTERERSSTLTRRLSVANQVHVNKLLQYASSPILTAPVYSNRLQQPLPMTKEENRQGKEANQQENETKEEIPPPPSYPPPDVIENMASSNTMNTTPNNDTHAHQVIVEDLEDQIRALKTDNKLLNEKIESLIHHNKRKDILCERPLIHVQLLADFIRALPNKHKEKVYERYSGEKETRPSGQVFNILFSFLAMAIRTQDLNSVTPQRSLYAERLQPYVSYIVDQYLHDGQLMSFDQLINDLPQWLIEVTSDMNSFQQKQIELQKEVTTLRERLEETQQEKEQIRRESISLHVQLKEMVLNQEERSLTVYYIFFEDSIDEVYKPSRVVLQEEKLRAKIDQLELDLADERHENTKIKESSKKSMWQLETQVKQLQEEIQRHQWSASEKSPVTELEERQDIQKNDNIETETNLRDERTWAEERLEFYKNEENLTKNELYIGWKKKAEMYKEELQKQKIQMRERDNSILTLIKWKEEAERLYHLEEENGQYKEQVNKLNTQLTDFQKSHEGKKVRAQSIYQLHNDVSNTLEQSKLHHEAIIEKYREDVKQSNTALSEFKQRLDILQKEKYELLSLLTKLTEQKHFEEQMRKNLLEDRQTLKDQVAAMEANKLLIVHTTSETIQSLRDHVKELSLTLRQYQNSQTKI
ncbi:viral A-type inclusion protein [Reticulomyxa filosa]|uniref:Viral A-type inclusion protein n=1 Tax=Reticulomyxa filosa TaxID=46433 RepID=X6NKA3_RETFI|nr:viral A-type inclusion protein [Reticulomyxa filosa]|eukprot:ETO26750.1 viral A-type inclusion protein [Reticulomyxa filosa]